ncbi:MAG: DUF4136 domain-containing protein [Polyangiaceae bacterium]
MRLLGIMLVSAALASAASVVGCESGAGVRAHASSLPTAPFASYHTFSFDSSDGAPGGYKTSASSAEIQDRMKPMIAAELQKKGYSPATAKGDFVIRFGSGRRNVQVPHSSSSSQLDSFMEEDESKDFVEGAIIVNAFDGANDGQIWHGSARTEINPHHVDDALLAKSIAEVLVKFPVASPSAAPAATPSADGGV